MDEVLVEVGEKLSILPVKEETPEEVIENTGLVVGEASSENQAEVQVNMPDNVDNDVEVDFEDENADDGAKALEFSRTLKIEYDPSEVNFWFTQLENEMYTCEVKSQWLKRCVLVKNLPPKIQADVKSLLMLKKSEAGEAIYKQVKMELLRIHAPKKEETYKKALSRVMTGLPSQLGEVLTNDICDKPVKMSGCCCAKAVNTLWSLQLPVQVRSHVANMDFNHATAKDVFQAADKVYLSTRPTEVSAVVAAVSAPQATEQDSRAQSPAVRCRSRSSSRRSRRPNGAWIGGDPGRPLRDRL